MTSSRLDRASALIREELKEFGEDPSRDLDWAGLASLFTALAGLVTFARRPVAPPLPSPVVPVVSRSQFGDRVWLSVDEAIEYTGMSRTELYVALQTGDLPGSQRSKRKKWRVHVDDLNGWMRGSDRR